MFGHIMVPYDNSEAANKALEAAKDLAIKYSSKLTIINCVPLNFGQAGEGAPYVETLKLLKQSASYSLSKLERGIQGQKIPYEMKVIEGTSIVEALVSYADIHHVDLIVMGSRGHGGFKKLLLGSTASGVSQHSKCPVLVVKDTHAST